MNRIDALVIGAGPAGLMAADELARAGRRVTIAEAKPSPARKFLMAGKSGLNITQDAPDILPAFGAAAGWLAPMLHAFGPACGAGLGARPGARGVHRLVGPGLSGGDEGLAPAARLARAAGGAGGDAAHPLALDGVRRPGACLRHARRPAGAAPRRHGPRAWAGPAGRGSAPTRPGFPGWRNAAWTSRRGSPPTWACGWTGRRIWPAISAPR